MEVEIVFSGLCAFHNVRDVNPTMPEPSMILIRTDGAASTGGNGSISLRSAAVAEAIAERRTRTRAMIDKEKGAGPAAGGAAGRRDVHIPYIAYDTRTTVVNDPGAFDEVPMAELFRFIELNGVEIQIENDPPGRPQVDDSYDLMVKKDDYWPEAADQWNRAFVPERGKQPKKSAVVGFMRFGTGTLSAGRLSPQAWRFQRAGDALIGVFAEEIIYSNFPRSGNEVVIRLLDVETGAMIREPLRFSPISDGVAAMKIFIGNNDRDDIDNAVQQNAPDTVPDNDHFRFFNQMASIPGPGPIPRVVRTRNRVPPGTGGGVSSGPCGPISSNGR